MNNKPKLNPIQFIYQSNNIARKSNKTSNNPNSMNYNTIIFPIF